MDFFFRLLKFRYIRIQEDREQKKSVYHYSYINYFRKFEKQAQFPYFTLLSTIRLLYEHAGGEKKKNKPPKPNQKTVWKLYLREKE